MENQQYEKVFVQLPQSVFEELVTGIRKIERSLEHLKVISPTEWLSVEEFLTKTKVSRFKFECWKSAGVLNIRKIGRKIYVDPKDVQRFFDNELQVPK
jgi:hypothetical protein